MSREQVVERPVSDTGVNGEAVTGAGRPELTADVPKSTLFRHPSDKLVGGVCGGLADYLGWDPTLVRVLWVGATLTTGGGGFLAYLALWLLLPVGTVKGGKVRPAALELNERSLGLAAKLLIGLGVVWLLANLGILPSLWHTFWSLMWVVFWPAVLIGIGYLLLRGAGVPSGWRFDLKSWQNRLRTDFKSPNREGMKASLRSMRENFPLKRSRQDRLFLGVCGG
ncbi:MAG TPA: PspC domain-containing protein, partial [Caldilineaceae bacterium]|nr:PspC domain-containing protein [Caldilineaceae bacterium]